MVADTETTNSVAVSASVYSKDENTVGGAVPVTTARKEEGLFIFQVTKTEGVQVHAVPFLDTPVWVHSVRYEFPHNHLVEVDCVVYQRQGAMVRLSDHSGWLPVTLNGNVFLRQVGSEFIRKGLWTFFVDNYPSGVCLRAHPTDSKTLLVAEYQPETLQPFQRIYCDVRVVHPVTYVNFYRLQTGGWVAERRPNSEHFDAWLVPERQVKTGLFCYRALTDMAVRSRPTVADSNKTPQAIPRDQLVAVDIVREGPQDGENGGNGPFIRLSDGMGWLFQSKWHDMVMEPVGVQRRMMEVRLLHSMRARRHPTTDSSMIIKHFKNLKSQQVVQTDAQVIDTYSGITYYRIHGSKGWIFNKRGETPMLEVLSASDESLPPSDDIPPLLGHFHGDQPDQLSSSMQHWTPEFVRGIAATVPDVIEVDHWRHARVLAFDKVTEKIRIHVYYATHTIGTMLTDHPLVAQPCQQYCHRNATVHDLVQAFRRDMVEIMTELTDETDPTDPTAPTGDKENVTASFTSKDGTSHRDDQVATSKQKRQVEEQLRNELMTCQIDIAQLLSKKQELWQQIHAFDRERIQAARDMKEETVRLMHEAHMIDPNAVTPTRGTNSTAKGAVAPKASSASSSRSSSRQKDAQSIAASVASSKGRHGHVCGECFHIFPGKYSRDLHCREVHGLFCSKCERIFSSFPELDKHRDCEEHW